MGRWDANDWVWELPIISSIQNHSAHEDLEDLCCILSEVEPSRHDDDKFIWIGGHMDGFAVREYYKKLTLGGMVEEGQLEIKEALKIMWNAWMPSKVKIFGWRLLKDRLATKDQLQKWIIIENPDLTLCVFGCGNFEDSRHLFLNCQIVRRVWEKLMAWLGLEEVTCISCCNHFMQVVELMRKWCSLRRAAIVWMATCWCI